MPITGGTGPKRELPAVADIIAKIAAEYGVPLWIPLAISYGESGWNPHEDRGDGGASVGLFQLHENGIGAGMGDDRYDAEKNTAKIMPYIAKAYSEGKKQGLTGEDLLKYVWFQAERPQDTPEAHRNMENSFQVVSNVLGKKSSSGFPTYGDEDMYPSGPRRGPADGPASPTPDASNDTLPNMPKGLRDLYKKGTALQQAWQDAENAYDALGDDDPKKQAANNAAASAKRAYETWQKDWTREYDLYKTFGAGSKPQEVPTGYTDIGGMRYLTDKDGKPVASFLAPKDDAEQRALGYLNFRLSAYSKLLEYGDIDEKQAQQHYQNEVAAYNQKIAAYREQREGTKNEYDMKRNQVQDDLNAWKDYMGATGEAAKLAFQTFQQVQPFLTSSQGPVQLSSMAPGGAMNQLYDTLGLKYQAPNPIGVMDVPDFTGPLKAAIGKMPQQTSVAPMQIPDFLSSVGPAPSAPPPANHDEQKQAVSFIKSLLGIQ